MVSRPSQKLPVAEARDVLRATGLRCTAARVAVLQCLNEEPTPLTHAEVTERLQEFGFDASTIYRCLTELADTNLLSRLDLGDGIRRFELMKRSGVGISVHPHFMCVDCGKIFCLGEFQVELVARQKGIVAPGEVTEALLKGHCAKCQN